MAQPAKRQSAANTPAQTPVRMSLTVANDLHLRIGVAASLCGKSRTAFLTDILKEATRHIVIVNRLGKSTTRGAVPDEAVGDIDESSTN